MTQRRLRQIDSVQGLRRLASAWDRLWERSEVPLTARYKMSSRDLFSDVGLVGPMLRRGKLPLLPHRIKGRKEIRKIFDLCRKGGHRR